MEKRTKESRKRINSLILLIAFTAIMLIVSTYAWFTSQKDITLSNLRGTVEVAENMEISLDAKTWKQEIDLSDATAVFTEAQSSRLSGLKADASDADDADILSAAAILPAELLPVSGIGETTETYMPLLAGEATSTTLEEIYICEEYDTTNSVMKDNGYFAFDIYIKNTARDGLDDILQLNLNSAVQALPTGVVLSRTFVEEGNTITRTYEGDPTSGIQNTVRVGLAMYSGAVSSTATQAEILTSTKTATVSNVAIWEPNAKNHVESIVENNNKLVNGASELTKFGAEQALTTYAILTDAEGSSLANVYNIADTNLAEQKTFQTSNRLTESDGAEADDYRIVGRDVETTPSNYDDDKPLNITDVEGNDFTIASNKITRFRVYVWLEGQDVDCINIASEGGGIEVDLGLTKDDFVGEVLTTN